MIVRFLTLLLTIAIAAIPLGFIQTSFAGKNCEDGDTRPKCGGGGGGDDSETTAVNAGNNEGFAYVASASEPVMDEVLHFNGDDSVKVARADALYSSSDRDETIEIDASEIIYSNTGVMAESPVDGADTQDESEFFGSEDILQDIIDISVSDIIYSDNKSFPNDPAS